MRRFKIGTDAASRTKSKVRASARARPERRGVPASCLTRPRQGWSRDGSGRRGPLVAVRFADIHSLLPRRRVLLGVSLAANPGRLGFLKYTNFVLESFVALLQLLGVGYRPPEMDIILPVGISFFTFQTLSYTFDVFRGRLKPWRSFLGFALFVTFFPQLVAGPIVRAVTFLPQCLEPRRREAARVRPVPAVGRALSEDYSRERADGARARQGLRIRDVLRRFPGLNRHACAL